MPIMIVYFYDCAAST